MSSESVSRAFCLESIRYAYQILGYDTLIKEIEFIHHLHSKYNTDSKNVTHSEIQISEEKHRQENTLSVSSPIPEQDIKSDVEPSQDSVNHTDQQKEVVLKAKRGRKPLSSKKSESTDIKPVIIHTSASNPNTCSFLLSNGSQCSIKRYTTENTQSVYCFQHYNIQQ